jgi:hypothetical protein
MEKVFFFFILLRFCIPGNSLFAQTEATLPQGSLPSMASKELHKKYATCLLNSVSKVTDKKQNTTCKAEKLKKQHNLNYAVI